YTATILEEPEYSDSKTIVRSGSWYIALDGYTPIIPGSRVRFEGIVEPQIQLGKVTRVVMKNAIIKSHGRTRGSAPTNIMIMLGHWRKAWVGQLQRTLPEPMASLSGGILLGVKAQMPRDFYQALVNTGTLHVIAASGFNVSVVAAVLMGVLMRVVSRGWAIGGGIGGIVVYVLIAGASASVIRAGIMGSLTLIAYYLGRPTEARRLLWVSAGIMLLASPLMLLDVGFQLSVAATAGLLYLEPWIKILSSSVGMTTYVQSILANYLYPTLAATIATLPVILWHFGTVSWISPIVNLLVLPIIPLIMGMSAGIL
ncbi:hypothetical protein COW38_00800, partial [Candidatus Collierbacteria bacterium CG17_big_fil_post_rev_8_21_14_2_50_45_7]